MIQQKIKSNNKKIIPIIKGNNYNKKLETNIFEPSNQSPPNDFLCKMYKRLKKYDIHEEKTSNIQKIK